MTTSAKRSQPVKIVDSHAERVERSGRKPSWKGEIKDSEVKWESRLSFITVSIILHTIEVRATGL